MRKCLIIILGIFLALALYQNVFSDKYGIKGGLNFAYVSNVEAAPGLDHSRHTGLIFGGFYRFDLNDIFALQPEVYYSQKGMQVSGTISGTQVTGKDLLYYIEIPVLMKVKIPAKGKFIPSLFAGPYASYLLIAKEKSEWNGESGEKNITDDLKVLDFGLAFGANLDYEIGKGSIILDVRYSLGLLKIQKEGDEPDSKNSSLTVMMGYAF